MKWLLLATDVVSQMGCLAALLPKPLAAPHVFGPGKRAALVMVNAHPKISVFTSDLFGLPKGTLLDAAPAFEGAMQIIRDELGRARHFALVPEKVVLASAAYHTAVGRSPDYGIVTFLTPPGYKYLTDEAEYPKLGRGIPADVAFAIGIHFHYTDAAASSCG
jgi:hypothetical protein